MTTLIIESTDMLATLRTIITDHITNIEQTILQPMLEKYQKDNKLPLKPLPLAALFVPYDHLILQFLSYTGHGYTTQHHLLYGPLSAFLLAHNDIFTYHVPSDRIALNTIVDKISKIHTEHAESSKKTHIYHFIDMQYSYQLDNTTLIKNTVPSKDRSLLVDQTAIKTAFTMEQTLRYAPHDPILSSPTALKPSKFTEVENNIESFELHESKVITNRMGMKNHIQNSLELATAQKFRAEEASRAALADSINPVELRRKKHNHNGHSHSHGKGHKQCKHNHGQDISLTHHDTHKDRGCAQQQSNSLRVAFVALSMLTFTMFVLGYLLVSETVIPEDYYYENPLLHRVLSNFRHICFNLLKIQK